MSDMYGVAQRAEELRRTRRCSSLALADRRGDEHGRRLDSGAAGGARRSGQALQKGKYQVLSAGENRARAMLRRCRSAARRSRACWLATRGRCSTPAMRSRLSSALLLARCCRWALARLLRPVLNGAAGRRSAGSRQPDSGAATHFGKRGGADVVAGAGRRLRGHGAGQLQVDHRLDGHGAEP